MIKYFAYGSNCDPAVMKRKGVRYTARRPAVLRGYQLLFNKKAFRDHLPESIGFANINRFGSGTVEGILYDLVAEDLDVLDATERYPTHYDRVRVVVEADSGEEECWAYQAQPEVTAANLVPSRNYLNHILAAGEFLSKQYFDALDQSHTYRADCVRCGTTGEVLFVQEASLTQVLCRSCHVARREREM